MGSTKENTSPFFLSNCSSSSHDRQHHQKLLQIDLIRPFIIEHDFFLARHAMYQIGDNIFVIFSHVSFNLKMAICCNLRNLYFLALHFLSNIFSNAYLSVLFALPASVHWITTSPATLFDDWARHEYIKYLAFFPGLSHLPSPLKQNYSPLSLCLKLHPDHLTTSRLQHQEDIYLKCNKKLILIQWGIAANSKFSYIFLNALELERPIGTILMLPW